MTSNHLKGRHNDQRKRICVNKNNVSKKHTVTNLKGNKRKIAITKTKNFNLDEVKRRLSGSRFRSLNEILYSSTSDSNWLMYNKNPALFKAYHEGYNHQISQWPLNPLEIIIAWLKTIEENKIIGDFGCGEALIAQTFTNRVVYSFDFVATNRYIIPCNILKVPLDSGILDISIFSLSLMGEDWPLFILEASRCLKKGGILKIVEVQSRFMDMGQFIDFIKSFGYNHLSDTNVYFKTDVFKTEELLNKSYLLATCPYKRR
ncbi:bifunctional S-adenosyl-L-methionine-dependent methyltransferase superfamily/Ribosomal RNA processing protein 8/Ribosomal RNA-processing protein 8 [Babesia duncani]|uniref:Ribosomal RNA-processing protein 8 n=1 Tax=Babesia duncani TaxID=323732 RepID=A0AAD9PI14_9APIC|nr:bifunctional S-adenosyl-L-methionine-dependent methyltransferase superfamily/Ribosomal RNA processing protein 8/Ribosomal RNA-processing protein 8 [Babesia duncani]